MYKKKTKMVAQEINIYGFLGTVLGKQTFLLIKDNNHKFSTAGGCKNR